MSELRSRSSAGLQTNDCSSPVNGDQNGSEPGVDSAKPGRHHKEKLPVSRTAGLSYCLRWFFSKFVSGCVLVIGILSVVVAPLMIKLFPNLPHHIVYLNAFKIPYHVNLSDPDSIDLHYTRNFYLTTDGKGEEKIIIGIWHALPVSLQQERNEDTDTYPELLSSGHPIILYCHGNTGHRGTDHRVDMYKVLAAQDYHVIALDYRGYGDSTGSPTSEDGVVSDVVVMYKWIRKQAPNSPLYIWGHSLGTGISMKTVRVLDGENVHPDGLILESPFNNIIDAAMDHPFSVPFKMFWWFNDMFLHSMHDRGIYLQSDEHIQMVDIPILILHAEDDYVVPYSLGVKLYEASKKRPAHFKPVTFHTFSKERQFMHKWICTAEELPSLVSDFMAQA